MDFSDSSKFNDSISGLMVGLKKIVSMYVTTFPSLILIYCRGEIEDDPEEQVDDATLEVVDQAGTSLLFSSSSSSSYEY